MKKQQQSVSKISSLIHGNLPFLRSLGGKCAKRQQENLIAGASDAELLCLVEICLNLLHGRLPAHHRRLMVLRRQADTLRRLSRARSPKTARRLLLQQKGGALPAVAGVLASILIPLIAEKILHK
jgi:hypothetical protein